MNMKKKLLLMAVAIMCLSASLQAQPFEPGTFSIMPRIGLNLSRVTNMPPLPVVNGFTMKRTLYPGVQVGADVEYQASERFSLQGGVGYSLQGCKWKDYRAGLIEITDTKISLSYINVPLLANFYIVEGLAVKAGIQAGFLLDARNKAVARIRESVGSPWLEASSSESFTGECNKVDWSIPIGVSYEFDNHLVLDLRYTLGLNRINKESDPDGDIRNRIVTLTVGYKIEM